MIAGTDDSTAQTVPIVMAINQMEGGKKRGVIDCEYDTQKEE
jgi:hypothetical protein